MSENIEIKETEQKKNNKKIIFIIIGAVAVIAFVILMIILNHGPKDLLELRGMKKEKVDSLYGTPNHIQSETYVYPDDIRITYESGVCRTVWISKEFTSYGENAKVAGIHIGDKLSSLEIEEKFIKYGFRSDSSMGSEYGGIALYYFVDDNGTHADIYVVDSEIDSIMVFFKENN